MLLLRSRKIVFTTALLAVSCADSPKSSVLSREASQAAWTSTGKVVFPEVVDTGPIRTAIRLYDPANAKKTTVAEVVGTVLFLDADDTDRILLGGIGGAYTILRQTGDVLYAIVNVPDATDGYLALHLSASGTKIALVTLPPMPDLQVHRVDTAATEQNFVDFEGTTNVRAIDWSPDDAFLFYLAGDPTGATPDRVMRVSSTNVAQKNQIFQDPSIPYLDRLFVSGDGQTLVVSGEDATGKTAVWTIPAAGGAATKIAEEGGNRLTVEAASGPSPDGERFVLYSTTARGGLLTVEKIEAVALSALRGPR